MRTEQRVLSSFFAFITEAGYAMMCGARQERVPPGKRRTTFDAHLFCTHAGVTGWPFRMTHLKHYGGVDRYYMPFISVHQTRAMKGGEKRDMDPSHNEMDRMVPQLLPADAEDTLFYMDMIRAAGYDEVSLNLGCPARTVVTKGKGSGMLADTGKLDGFLEHLFTGMTSAGEQRSVGRVPQAACG